MTSKTEICNLALIEAGYDETITNMDERSVSAERCNRLYDVCRKEILVGYPWVFASKFVSLARLKETIEGFDYVYAYPDDALRVVNVFENVSDYKNKNNREKLGSQERVAYLNGRKVIPSNYEQAFGEIIVDEKLEDKFPPMFTRMLYLDMSIRLAKLAGADNTRIQLLVAQFQQAEAVARMQSVGEDDNNVCAHDFDEYINVRA